MTRALLFGAMLLSLVVPCGAAAYALGGTGSTDGAAVQLPAETQPAPEAGDDPLVVDDTAAPAADDDPLVVDDTVPESPSAPQTREVVAADGSLVKIDKSCGRAHDVDAREANVTQARGKLPALNRRLGAAKSVFSAFLDAHPDKTLPAAEFSRYESLRARYEAALAAYNGQIDVADRYALRYHAIVDACRI